MGQTIRRSRTVGADNSALVSASHRNYTRSRSSTSLNADPIEDTISSRSRNNPRPDQQNNNNRNNISFPDRLRNSLLTASDILFSGFRIENNNQDQENQNSPNRSSRNSRESGHRSRGSRSSRGHRSSRSTRWNRIYNVDGIEVDHEGQSYLDR